MSEMSFDDIIRNYNQKNASDPRGVSGGKDDLNPSDYTSIVYLRDGSVYEYPGTMAADLGVRIIVPNGVERLASFNADHVMFYEVVLTSALEADSE